jgi:hypothetical protein
MTWEFVADRPEFEWLTEKSGGWQFGEQGILVALAEQIGSTGQCVEIGAGNGETLPLTIDPFYSNGNACVLYEKNSESLGRLMMRYPQAKHRGEFASAKCGEFALVPLLVVIDVDSVDSVLMEDVLAECLPRILMVEHFDKCHAGDTDLCQRVPRWLLGRQLTDGFIIQDNAATIKMIADKHQYARLGTTRVNSIFVHDSLVEKVTNHVPS